MINLGYLVVYLTITRDYIKLSLSVIINVGIIDTFIYILDKIYTRARRFGKILEELDTFRGDLYLYIFYNSRIIVRNRGLFSCGQRGRVV